MKLVNEIHLAGNISFIREIETRTGTPMTAMKMIVNKEIFNCVAFKGLAQKIVSDYKVDDWIEIKGLVQNNNWQKEDGTKVYDYQIVIGEIVQDDRWKPEGVGGPF